MIFINSPTGIQELTPCIGCWYKLFLYFKLTLFDVIVCRTSFIDIHPTFSEWNASRTSYFYGLVCGILALRTNVQVDQIAWSRWPVHIISQRGEHVQNIQCDMDCVARSTILLIPHARSLLTVIAQLRLLSKKCHYQCTHWVLLDLIWIGNVPNLIFVWMYG